MHQMVNIPNYAIKNLHLTELYLIWHNLMHYIAQEGGDLSDSEESEGEEDHLNIIGKSLS
jgi:hypothetical protein